jgi:glyoxalase family protein
MHNQLKGLHHVTAVTGNAQGNLHFYTTVLGLRLVKKTVNQDDTSAYHLFYADKLGSPGTDITFFDWPQTGPVHGDTDGIVCTMFRVHGMAALEYWQERFTAQKVPHDGIEYMGEVACIRFQDPEGQRLMLVDDEDALFEGVVWDGGDIPTQFGLRGFYGIQVAIPNKLLIEGLLTHALGFKFIDDYSSLDNAGEKVYRYGLGDGGPGKQLHIVERSGERLWVGSGGVHHVAFRVESENELKSWLITLNQIQMPSSGLVDRYYFKSLYFRLSEGILFELATDGPGFGADEPLEELGSKLALPPFLEPHRVEIEAGLTPLI